MLISDSKLERALAPHLERVLIVDHAPASTRMLIELLHNIHRGKVWNGTSTAQAVSMAQTANPQIVFTDYLGPDIDGLAFTRALRRSGFTSRKVPVIMVTAQATPGAILGARDSGVHEFLRKPYTNKDLLRRLEAALLRPRSWVEAVGYIGPDRRRFNSGEYQGARKRRSDTTQNSDEADAVQALRIVASAVNAIETDPQQAFRSLKAQAEDLQHAASAMGNQALKSAAEELQAKLAAVGSPERMTPADLEPLRRRLMAFLPTAAAKPAQASRPAA